MRAARSFAISMKKLAPCENSKRSRRANCSTEMPRASMARKVSMAAVMAQAASCAASAPPSCGTLPRIRTVRSGEPVSSAQRIVSAISSQS